MSAELLQVPAVDAGGSDDSRSNLFFQFGVVPQDSAEADASAAKDQLEHGRVFQAVYIVSESAQKFRDVTMTVSLKGIKVSEPNSKKRTRDFEIEQILQYSYNRTQERFTFAYLEADGILTNYRFISKDFFDIHQTLGSAIAMMVSANDDGMEDESRDNVNEQFTSGTGKTASDGQVDNDSEHDPAQAQVGDRLASTSEPSLSLGDLQIDGEDADEADSAAKIKNAGASQHQQQHQQQQQQVSQEAIQVVHGGDDDQTSIFTVETHMDATDVTEDDSSSIRPPASPSDSSTIRDASGKKEPQQQSQQQQQQQRRPGDQKSKTVRGWSLFSGQRTSHGSKPMRMSTNELMSIDENNLKQPDAAVASSLERVQVKSPKSPADSQGGRPPSSGTIGRGKLFGSMSVIEKRRSSNLTSFVPGSASDQNSGHGIAQSAMLLHEGASSSASIDSQVMREPKDLPAVVKRQDQWGRDALFKNLKGGKYDITGGTVEMLVESLAEEAPPDTLYIDVFLLTFRHFMTPIQFITLLQKRFNQQHDLDTSSQGSSVIRVRVVSVLKKWAERHYYDFRFPEMQKAFNDFLQDINKTECAKYGQAIKATIDSETERSKSFVAAPLKQKPPANIQAQLDQVDITTMFSPKRIAQELTLVDLKLFRQIKPDEFCIYLWGEKGDPRIANFNTYVDRFNQIGFWIGTVVCQLKDIKKRVEAIEKFIQIMRYCHKYQNYSTMMAMYSGLNTNAMSRIKKTWELVAKGKWYSTYVDLEAKLSYRGNFKAYREIECNSKPPFIPFFGLYVKDLTFMNDGNQKHLAVAAVKQQQLQPQHPGGIVESSSSTALFGGGQSYMTGQSPLSASAETFESTSSPAPVRSESAEPAPPMAAIINFEKCRSITDKIHALRVFQQSTYKFEEEKEDKDGFFSSFTATTAEQDALLQAYLGAPFGPPAIDDEARLLAMSKECEPSERTAGSYVASPALAAPTDASKPRDPTSGGSTAAVNANAVGGSAEIRT